MQLEGPHAVALACVVITIAVYAIRWYTDPLRAIPTVGGSPLPGLSYFSARYSLPDLKELLKEGYRKYPESAFKIAHHLDKWAVIVSGRRMVEELRKRPDEELSAALGQAEVRITTSENVRRGAGAVILTTDRTDRRFFRPNTRSRHRFDVVDEISVTVSEHIAARDDAWTSIHVVPMMRDIVARASNRAFVGLPLCRNKDYLAQAIGFAVHVHADASALRLVPSFMKPFVALFVRNVRHHTDLAVPHLQPIIEERMKASAELGEGWNDKPNDMLQLILDKAIPMGESPTIIVQRLMVLNFAAISTSTNTTVHVLYHLAENPSLLTPLREEIEAIIATDGWTPTALGRMWKLDSLLQETLRYHGVSLLSMNRTAMKDLTLGDGTRIPRGTVVAAAAHATHHDDAVLANADAFDTFRFARMRAAAPPDDSSKGLKHQFTSTSPEYISFGHGPHACPGRSFAANELKAILARIVLDYDLKLDGGDGARPADVYYGVYVVPAPDGRVSFRKRQASAV